MPAWIAQPIGCFRQDSFTGIPSVSFSSRSGFAINSGFQAGMNTLLFRIVNAAGTSGNPTGLVVSSLSGSADNTGSSVPEPSVTALLIPGLLGLTLRQRILQRRWAHKA